MNNIERLQSGVHLRFYIRNMSWGGRVLCRYNYKVRPVKRYRIKRVRIGNYSAHDSKARRCFKLPDTIMMRADGTTIARTFTKWTECIKTMHWLDTHN